MMCHLLAMWCSAAPGVSRRGPAFQLKMLMRVCSSSTSLAALLQLVHGCGASSRLSLAAPNVGTWLPLTGLRSRRTALWSKMPSTTQPTKRSLSRQSRSTRKYPHHTVATLTCEGPVQLDWLRSKKLRSLRSGESTNLEVAVKVHPYVLAADGGSRSDMDPTNVGLAGMAS